MTERFLSAVLMRIFLLSAFLALMAVMLGLSGSAWAQEDYRAKGQENWVRFTFRVVDADSGKELKSTRVYYMSKQAADWFHPENHKPLLPAGKYRLVAWDRNYFQWEGVLVVDPALGLRQQKTIRLKIAAPKDKSSKRFVPDFLKNLVYVGNATQSMAHMNGSWFGFSSTGRFTVYSKAWSEYPGVVAGSKSISTFEARYWFFHDAKAAAKHFQFKRKRFKAPPVRARTQKKIIRGPTTVALGDQGVQITIRTPRIDGGSGTYHESRRFLIRDGSVVLQLYLSHGPNSRYITTPEEVLSRIRALDKRLIKRLLEPEPHPWPEYSPRPGSVESVSHSPTITDGHDYGTERERLESSTLSEEISPGTTAAVALTAGGIAAGGALAMLGMSGVGRREIVDSVRDLVNGEPVVDEFEAWKEKYEAMGWRYSEENGFADFEPVDGAVNEGGWVYSSEHGGFIPPEGERPEPELQPEFKDGDVNPDTDEVWSDEDGGWVGRNLYEQEKARAGEIADIEARSEEAMQAEDEKTRDLGRKVADADRQRDELAKVFDARRTLEDAIHQIWQQDLKDGVLDEERRKLLAKLERKAEQISMRKDRTGVVEDTLALADIIGHQARNGFKVTYTYRDMVFDTTIQTGAAILDAVVTRGYASSVVGSGLAMRDAAREGKGGTDILYEGAKAAAFDFVIGKAADVVGGAVRATSTAWREAGEAVEEATKITRKLDGVAHGGSDLLTQTERNLNRMRENLSIDVRGRPRAKLEDVLEVQRNPHQVRNLKGTGSQELQNGFNNTLRSDVYKPHDKALIQRIKAANPDLADKKLVVHEFRTPGKSGSGINTDRDFRMLYKNDKGEWLEVPRKKWEKDSNEIFGKLTGYDPKKCPADIPDGKKMEWWAEHHGHTPTDRSFREACPDYSDQMLNQAGERVRVGKPRIQELKELADPEVIIKGKPDNPLRLRDPVSIGSQFDEKIATNMRIGDSFEAVAQAKKGVDTLEQVRTAYSKQKIDAGALPERFSKAMDLIKKSNLPSHPDPTALRNFNNNLQQLGFADLDTFGKALSGQFESLKYAK